MHLLHLPRMRGWPCMTKLLLRPGDCPLEWTGGRSPNRRHMCDGAYGHTGDHQCRYCPETAKQVFIEKKGGPMSDLGYAFSTPQDLRDVYEENIEKAIVFVAKVIQSRLSKEETGPRQIGIVISQSDSEESMRHTIVAMTEALARLSDALLRSGWVATGDVTSGKLIVTLIPT